MIALPRWGIISKKLVVSLERLRHSQIPERAALGWITTDEPWFVAPGSLQTYVDRLSPLVKQLRTDEGRWYEQHYVEKLLPRNVFLLVEWLKKLRAINWFQPDCGILYERVIAAMQVAGLCRTKGIHGSIMDVRAPSGSTSLGVCVIDDQVWTGEKKEFWITMLAQAVIVRDWCYQMSYTWDNIDLHARSIIEHFNLLFVPSVRLDRGPFKNRLLFMGNTVMYILENWMGIGLKADMKACPSFGYHPKWAAKFAEEMPSGKILSGDFEAMDLHVSGDSLKAAWRAWQVAYDLPECIMTVLYAYSRYAPIARWEGNQLVLQERDAINPSGAGVFTLIMNILCLFYRVDAVSYFMNVSYDQLSRILFGIGFGDDHVLPMPDGVTLQMWEDRMKLYGMNAGGSRVRHGEFKFLRMLFQHNSIYEPLIFSRFRNAACPEDTGIASRSKYLTAIALRAQLIPFQAMSERNSTYKSIYEVMCGWFSPKDQLLLDLDDDDLARSLTAGGGRDLDALFFAKRIYGVRDAGDLLRSRL